MQSSKLWSPPAAKPTGGSSLSIVRITRQLLQTVTRQDDLALVTSCDLHLRDDRFSQQNGRIRVIECMDLMPNLLQLNLSYNLITIIDGLKPVSNLVELNLAENSIRKVKIHLRNKKLFLSHE